MSEVIAVDAIRQYVDRVNRLESDKAEIMDDIKQVYDEAKANGFDIKILKKVIKLSNTDRDKLSEEEALTDLYRSALDI